MADTRDKVGRAGVFLAGGVFKIALYICIIVFLIWIGKSTYQFGYDVFNQQAMSPGEGQQVTVVVKEGSSAYDAGRTLEQKGLEECSCFCSAGENVRIPRKDQGRYIPFKYSLHTDQDTGRAVGRR